ncbi:MAG TPA: hypothetical protein VMH30_13835 [Verrucomicrobiae bacterium]|nr:hypothetical protein [Verrucomicrobiae bacterium]
MNCLFVGFFGAMLAASQPSDVTNPTPDDTNAVVGSTNVPMKQQLDDVMTDDDAAMDEVDQWIRDNNAAAAKGGGETRSELNDRINARLDQVRQKYQDFLRRYPDYAPGHLAYGSFLDDIGKEDLAAGEFETASKLDPKDPAAWNGLANYYGENGPITNAFIDYQKAIALNPTEPVYYENLATTVYLFRRDAMAFYGITEPQVFDKSLALYRKAIQLAPDDFELASDYAESYYGIRPLRTNDALVAWTNALSAAHNDAEREGVYIHLARIKFIVGRYAEARSQLEAVTNSMYADLKNRIERNIVAKENARTNAVPNNPPGTNSLKTSTNILMTSSLSASNPPPFSPKEASVLTNVPPGSPQPKQLEPLQARSTKAPAPSTNLLNNLEVAPPAPRPLTD